jgi:transposase
MHTPQYFIGLDIAAESFTASVGIAPWQILLKPISISNSPEGFQEFHAWMQQQHLLPDQCVLCMEATGVYGEALSYFLVAAHYSIAVEPPLKVRRAFHPAGHKSDPVDSQQIAEYACRFLDELHLWQPPLEMVEQIQVLLTTREQFTVQMTAHRHALATLAHKPVKTPLAEQVHHQAIQELKSHIQTLEQEIRRLIDQDSSWRKKVAVLQSIPGVGFLLTAHLLASTQGFTRPLLAKQLAAYARICPYEHTSGKSVYRKPKAPHQGPSALRKLLYLSALSVRTHNAQFEKYFLRKVAEGKPKRLVINNIENKLLRIISGVLKSETPFIANYRSVNPKFLKAA